MRPFVIAVSDPVLDDLRARLVGTRWPDEVDGAGWELGPDLGYLQERTTYWRDTFDWRRVERQLNSFPQVMTEINGLPIHAVHVRGNGPCPLPLVLTHGWPARSRSCFPWSEP